jgi:predicted ATPase
MCQILGDHDGVQARVDEWRAAGAEYLIPYFLALLAQVELGASRPRAALDLLGEARSRTDRSGERWYAAEVLRLEGKALATLGCDRVTDAESCFARTIKMAAESQAHFWELRAAANLAWLWRDQGKHSEACDLLAPVYGWFTEGFDTPDLQEAKALLDELTLTTTGAGGLSASRPASGEMSFR